MTFCLQVDLHFQNAIVPPKDKENTDQDDNPPKRRSARLTRNTRSMAEDDIVIPEKIEIKRKLPFINYKGAIKYYTEGHEIAEASDLIL